RLSLGPVVAGSMPASRISRPSLRRKLRPSMMLSTRPSPCSANAQAAARADSVAAANSQAHNAAMANRLIGLVMSAWLALLYALLIRNGDEGAENGNQRHGACHPDGLEFRALPGVLPQAVAVSRADACHRQRRLLLLRRRPHCARHQRAVGGICG